LFDFELGFSFGSGPNSASGQADFFKFLRANLKAHGIAPSEAKKPDGDESGLFGATGLYLIRTARDIWLKSARTSEPAESSVDA
jgi:hypothetical protein